MVCLMRTQAHTTLENSTEFVVVIVVDTFVRSSLRRRFFCCGSLVLKSLKRKFLGNRLPSIHSEAKNASFNVYIHLETVGDCLQIHLMHTAFNKHLNESNERNNWFT